MKQTTKTGSVPVQPEEVMDLFGSLFSRKVIKELLPSVAPNQQMYWRVLTPLIVLWGFVYQRLQAEHSCDAYVSHLHSGAADKLDQADPHEQPLSQRLASESTAGYAQGRQRLPIRLLQEASRLAAGHAQTVSGDRGRWRGKAVRLLDGTTFLLPLMGDLAASYGQAQTKAGPSNWAKARAVVACDWFSQAVMGIAEGAYSLGESKLVLPLLQQDEENGALYVGDRNFGIYRVVQAIVGTDHHALFRMKNDRANSLLKRQSEATTLQSGEWCLVEWTPTRHDQCFPELTAPTIPGRLLYLRIERDGFRSFDLYLFTTLLDEEQYPIEALFELYAQRWQVEIHFRHIKTTLELDFFDVRSADMFRKELAAGVLTYNLICVLITRAAQKAKLLPRELSFKQCMRRIHSFLTHGVPAWVHQKGDVTNYLLDRLARCKLPRQPNKVRHEPRAIRYKPRPYAALRGSREDARQKNLENLKRSTKS